MKKLVNTSFYYGIIAAAGGVFYREFTKLSGFEGDTVLSLFHTHIFTLGMLFFIIVALSDKQFELSASKKFKKFFGIYNLGLIITGATFLWRGILQVLGTEFTKALDSSISGIAGIGHILLGIGIVLFFLSFKEKVANM